MNKPKSGGASADQTNDDAVDANAPGTEADTNPKAGEAPPSIDHISDLIEAAAKKYAPSPEQLGQMIDTAVQKIDLLPLIGQAMESKLPTAEALRELVDEAVKGIDVTNLVDVAIEEREERVKAAARDAEFEALEKQEAAQKAATAETKKAERAVLDAEAQAEKRRQKVADRARREYEELVLAPIASALAIGDADSIELRFGNGETFLPDYALTDIDPSQLAFEDDRPVLSLDVEPTRDLVPFEASEALLLVEGGKGPISVWRCELYPPARLGGGLQSRFPAGSLMFRQLLPAPPSDAAA